MKFPSKKTSQILLSILILLAIIVTTVLFEWSPSSTTNQSKGPTDKCGLIEPTDQDVKKALSLGKELFETADWEKSYTVEPYKVTVVRQNKTEAAIAMTEYLIFTCGYGQTELNNYFSDESFNTFFADYESHVITNFCEKPNDIALYQLDLLLKGTEYISRFWVKQDTDTRLLTMRLVFPKSGSAQLDEYSKQIFPELTSCK